MNKKIRKFSEFIKESTLGGIDPDIVQDMEINNEFIQDDDIEDIQNDTEPEEIEDLLKISYNKRIDEWDTGEMDEPSDFDVFYDWFMDEIDDDISSTSSMKEEGDEVIFHIPEDIYVKYLEDIEDKTDEGETY